MTEEWRLLETGFHSAAENMAIDRAILKAHSQNKVPPTVRFYGWTPAAISIGYFQSLTAEVDLASCKKYGIDYVRRITGGGAVFHDDEVTYSIVIDEHHPSIPENIMESYARICGAIIKGLQTLDIAGNYAPINDILVHNKKISGNAQTRKYNTVLQHGTILTDVDVEKMFTLLKVPNEKIKDKLISDVKQRVTSVKHVVGKKTDFDTVADSLKKGFEEEFDIKFKKGALTREEKKLALQYAQMYFASNEWNHKR